MKRIDTGSIRVSSDEQKKKGQMINYYMEDLLRYGVKKENIFIELARSGSMNEDRDVLYKVDYHNGILWSGFRIKQNRPELWNWIEMVDHEKVARHIITKWDRLARDSKLGLTLIDFAKNKGTKIIPTQDTDDERIIPVIIAFAQQEAERTKERIYNNKMFKFEHGMYLGTIRLYGYKKTKIKIDDREYLHLVPYESERQLVEDVFSDNYYKDVLEKYNLSKQAYYSIRKNRFYCGYIEYKKIEKKGIHEPLITEERWFKYNH